MFYGRWGLGIWLEFIFWFQLFFNNRDSSRNLNAIATVMVLNDYYYVKHFIQLRDDAWKLQIKTKMCLYLNSRKNWLLFHFIHSYWCLHKCAIVTQLMSTVVEQFLSLISNWECNLIQLMSIESCEWKCRHLHEIFVMIHDYVEWTKR